MKINGNQIKIGNVLEHKGTLFVVTKTQAVKPGKGGASVSYTHLTLPTTPYV